MRNAISSLARVTPEKRHFERLLPNAATGHRLCELRAASRTRSDDGRVMKLVQLHPRRSQRQVDWLHIPLLDRTDDAYYRPLSSLRPVKTRIHLGLIHNMRNFERRFAAARTHLPDFVVAACCGFGRRKPSGLDDVLQEHLRAVDVLERSKRDETAEGAVALRGAAKGAQNVES